MISRQMLNAVGSLEGLNLCSENAAALRECQKDKRENLFLTENPPQITSRGVIT